MVTLVTRKELNEKFNFSLSTVARDLRGMKSNHYFEKYIKKYGHQTVRINLAGYEEDLRFKEEYKKHYEMIQYLLHTYHNNAITKLILNNNLDFFP